MTVAVAVAAAMAGEMKVGEAMVAEEMVDLAAAGLAVVDLVAADEEEVEVGLVGVAAMACARVVPLPAHCLVGRVWVSKARHQIFLFKQKMNLQKNSQTMLNVIGREMRLFMYGGFA